MRAGQESLKLGTIRTTCTLGRAAAVRVLSISPSGTKYACVRWIERLGVREKADTKVLYTA